MSPVKKILFTSCSAGLGHVRAAEALYLYCKKYFPEIECAQINLADYATSLFNLITVKGYNFTARHLPKVYDKLYRWNDDEIIDIKKLNLLIRANTQPFVRFIKEYAPDVIIATHFLIPPLIRRMTPHIPIDLVVTDYYANSVWEDPQVRQYFLPCDDTVSQFSKNIKFTVTGLPLHPDFFEPSSSPSPFLKSLGIPNGQKTILIMAGGTGSINIPEAVDKIVHETTNINIVIITGKNNRKIYEQLAEKQKYYPSIKLLEFTDKIADIIKQADLVITKPGGMIISECVHLGKPLILINPIPGQEEKNAQFLEKNGWGIMFGPNDTWSEIIKNNINKKIPPSTNNPNKKIISLSANSQR